MPLNKYVGETSCILHHFKCVYLSH